MNKDLFNYWKPFLKLDLNNMKDIKDLNINFGPQHPAAHGVLRLILQLRNELIERTDTHIGYLHRGSEKLIENKNYLANLPYFDRMDYISVLTQEHSYCLAIEHLIGVKNYQMEYTQIRVLFDEFTRILNHIFAITTHSLDVGCMAPAFWGFEEREKIMEFYERVSGARMHTAFYRPNESSYNYITKSLIKDILSFIRGFLKRIMMIENKLMMTSIWKYRLSYVGMFTPEFINSWGITGVLARSGGIKRDIRLSFYETYASYSYLNIRSFVSYNGDCYDRYLLRMREIVESVHIILQIINKLNLNYFKQSICSSFDNFYFNYLSKNNIITSLSNFKKSWYNNMEYLINHFKNYSEGFNLKSGFIYKSVEGPKGENGVTLISNGSSKPFKCKIKSASYYNLQSLNAILQGHFFADLVTIIGSQDIVMGEVDR
uniref:NADH dehydrogenase subunit 7 n=1 Tax=Gruberia lanceolata TaxID=1978530 RepID=A0A6C0UA64_9CILI|nr:NADH dehydrogenase subunit 7 [Gruberia lanceolata]